jgi:hypothetical protein
MLTRSEFEMPSLSQVELAALSRGERVDRDGAFTSRRGPGEGSFAGRARRESELRGFLGPEEQGLTVHSHVIPAKLVLRESGGAGIRLVWPCGPPACAGVTVVSC